MHLYTKKKKHSGRRQAGDIERLHLATHMYTCTQPYSTFGDQLINPFRQVYFSRSTRPCAKGGTKQIAQTSSRDVHRIRQSLAWNSMLNHCECVFESSPGRHSVTDDGGYFIRMDMRYAPLTHTRTLMMTGLYGAWETVSYYFNDYYSFFKYFLVNTFAKVNKVQRK